MVLSFIDYKALATNLCSRKGDSDSMKTELYYELKTKGALLFHAEFLFEYNKKKKENFTGNLKNIFKKIEIQTDIVSDEKNDILNVAENLNDSEMTNFVLEKYSENIKQQHKKYILLPIIEMKKYRKKIDLLNYAFAIFSPTSIPFLVYNLFEHENILLLKMYIFNIEKKIIEKKFARSYTGKFRTDIASSQIYDMLEKYFVPQK